MEERENIEERVAVETKANGSQIYNEPYSSEAIERLKSLVINFHNRGEKKYYSIHVDGETVVARNCDGRKFNDYLPFMSDYTKLVEVKLYAGYSPKCNRYMFYLHRGLSGVSQTEIKNVDVQQKIKEALKQERLQNELNQLRAEVVKKERKIKKLKKVNDDHPTWPMMLTDLANSGANIAGLLGFGKNRGLQGAPEQVEADSEVEIEVEDSEESTSETHQIFQDLHAEYGEKGMKKLFGWLAVLAAHPELQKKLHKEFEKLAKEKEDKDGEA